MADWDAAAKHVEAIPAGAPEWCELRLELAEAQTKAGQLKEALKWYNAIAQRDDVGEYSVQATFYAAELERDLGHITKALADYQTVLQSMKENAATRERLAFILMSSGQAYEAQPHFLALVKGGTAQASDLGLLGDLDRGVDQQVYLDRIHKLVPEDPIINLGIASRQFWDGRLAEAEPNLRAILKANPNYLSNQAMLGELLVNRERSVFLAWHDALPAAANDHPRIWQTRGLWARHENAPEVAARCFWEALRREPTSRVATTHLAQILHTLKHPAANDFQSRYEDLAQLTQSLDRVLEKKWRQESQLRVTAEHLETLGRYWEACAWALLADNLFQGLTWTGELFQRRQPLLKPDLPQVVDEENLALRHDLSRYPDFESLVTRVRQQATEIIGGFVAGDIQFQEETSGPDFVYESGMDPATRGKRTFEQTGGCVAVLDYDLNGTPDLFFSQGSSWITGESKPTIRPTDRDQLYRGQGSLGFQQVSAFALPIDQGFGQGANVGDVDQDGFPDLYVGNIGRNQLLHNMGDGTFEDLTQEAGLTAEDWTSSPLLADINGDTISDLYDVNYTHGEAIYTKICNGRACSPKGFLPTAGRVHLGRGDGTFNTLPESIIRAGKGLGVVTLPREDGGLSVFIANDQIPNQLITLPNMTSTEPLEDTALRCGVAMNEDGTAMAGMGIAADDVDGNGTIDLYVSNFKDEPNTLYVQDPPGLFNDISKVSGLRAASMDFVGWGTQFLDADRNGTPDIVLANGHVDDYRDEGGEYEMRPQFFRNDGDRRFTELFLKASETTFFGRKQLGRGLARLDWNQDGLMDIAVSNIAARAALVTNTTPDAGHYLNVKLHGSVSNRDAIGAKLIVTTANNRTWTKYLLAGDGYMASNERVVQFGLGSTAAVRELRVEWPSGTGTRIEAPPIDTTLEIVEGRPTITSWIDGLPGPVTARAESIAAKAQTP